MVVVVHSIKENVVANYPAPERHEVWPWLFIDDFRVPNFGAYVMNDFGDLVRVTYKVTRICLRAGDA